MVGCILVGSARYSRVTTTGGTSPRCQVIRVEGEEVMHRRLVVVAVVGLLAALIVPAAFADQPTIQRRTSEVHTVLQSCGFPVQWDGTGKVVDILYADELGNFLQRFQAAPETSYTLTNLVTGKSITRSTSGPQDLTFAADGTVTQKGTGVWLWPSRNPVTLEPGIFFTKGMFVLTRSAAVR